MPPAASTALKGAASCANAGGGAAASRRGRKRASVMAAAGSGRTAAAGTATAAAATAGAAPLALASTAAPGPGASLRSLPSSASAAAAALAGTGSGAPGASGALAAAAAAEAAGPRPGTAAAEAAERAAAAGAAGAAEAAWQSRLAAARAAAALGPFPRKLRDWRVEDVARFVAALALPQHAAAFAATGVDGEFLLQLSAKELRHTLGLQDRAELAALLHGREELRRADLRNDANEALRRLDPEAVFAVAGLQGASAALMAGLEAFRAPPLPAVFALAAAGKAARVEHALQAGFDPHARDGLGNTLFIAAARGGHRRVLDLLLARGADAGAANARGNTALHFVADPQLKPRADPDGTLAAFLVARGADPERRNARNWRARDGLGEPEGALASIAAEEAARTRVAEAGVPPRAPRRPNLLFRGAVAPPQQQQQQRQRRARRRVGGGNGGSGSGGEEPEEGGAEGGGGGGGGGGDFGALQLDADALPGVGALAERAARAAAAAAEEEGGGGGYGYGYGGGGGDNSGRGSADEGEDAAEGAWPGLARLAIATEA